MNGVLFIIGVQELGKGYKPFSKEEKQDLMHIGICRVLSQSGTTSWMEATRTDGHWKIVKKLPHFDLLEQEKLLKMHSSSTSKRSWMGPEHRRGKIKKSGCGGSGFSVQVRGAGAECRDLSEHKSPIVKHGPTLNAEPCTLNPHPALYGIVVVTDITRISYLSRLN